MDQGLAVVRGLEDGPSALKLLPQFFVVREVAIVGDGDGAQGIVHGQGLGILDVGLARRGVPDMADRPVTGKTRQDLFREDVSHQAQGPVHRQVPVPGGRDACAFLAAMLQSMQTQIRQVGRFWRAVHAEDSTLVVEMVIFDEGQLGRTPGLHGPHAATGRRRRTPTGESIALAEASVHGLSRLFSNPR